MQSTRLGLLAALMLGAAGCATVVPPPTDLPTGAPPAPSAAPDTGSPSVTPLPSASSASPSPSPSLQPMPPLDGPGLEPGTTVIAYEDATGDSIRAGMLHKVRAGTYFDVYFACAVDTRIKLTVTYGAGQAAGTPPPLTGFEGPCRPHTGSVFSSGGLDRSAFLGMTVETSAEHYWVQLVVNDSAILR